MWLMLSLSSASSLVLNQDFRFSFDADDGDDDVDDDVDDDDEDDISDDDDDKSVVDGKNDE